MTRWTLAGFMAMAALGVVGAPVQADPPANPFPGSWSGTWSVEGEVRGTFAWTISINGRIDGTLTHTGRSDGNGEMVGRVRPDGSLIFVGMVPDDTPGNLWGNGYSFKGTAMIDSEGKLVASVTLVAGPFSYALVAVLERN